MPQSPDRPQPPDRAAELESLQLHIQPQPDDTTCGPTCLDAIYRYYGQAVPLEDLIVAVPKTPSGGTADVYLANDALRRGFKVAIHTHNIRMFDPTWFAPGVDIAQKLRAQKAAKGAERPVLTQLTPAYVEFLERGGELHFTDLNAAFLRRHLKRGVPVLTGPNVQNFQEIANEFHREGALVFVKDAAELAREIVSFVTDKARRDEVGGKGRALIEPNRGALGRTVDGLSALIN